MRHRKGFNHLGRTSSHRKAMLSNMACSLIKHKKITTTTAKAKELRTYLEPLITRSKVDSTHNRRVVFSYLQDKDAVSELFREVAGKVADRPGGYTRILKIGNRIGDNADMCLIELVDYNESLLSAGESKQKASRRRRSRKKSEAVEAAVPESESLKESKDETSAPAEELPSQEEPLEEVKETPVQMEAAAEETETAPEQNPEDEQENKEA